VFYQGDILTTYAIIGFFLIPFVNLSNKIILVIAIVLMLQPYEWVNFFNAIQSPNVKLENPVSWSYYDKMGNYIPYNSFIKTIVGNLTNGKPAAMLWTWENGRVFQTLSLFLLGMVAGRKSLFLLSDTTKRFWMKVLLISILLFIPLYILKNKLDALIGNETISRPLLIIETTWTNLSFMFILVSGFVLLFQTKVFYKILNIFSPIGRMSLSNYILQSIMGSFIYYGFGLGLYKYTGATYCLIIGIILAIFQGWISSWWIKKYNQGPFEIIWHKLTWIKIK
jgi:uncharacterized protein